MWALKKPACVNVKAVRENKTCISEQAYYVNTEQSNCQSLRTFLLLFPLIKLAAPLLQAHTYNLAAQLPVCHCLKTIRQDGYLPYHQAKHTIATLWSKARVIAVVQPSSHDLQIKETILPQIAP